MPTDAKDKSNISGFFLKKKDCDSNVHVHVHEPSAKRTKYATTKVKNHIPWIVELDLRIAEKETLSNSGWLNTSHPDAALRVIKRHWPHIDGLQSCFLANNLQFDIVRRSDMVQILHCCAQQHWICVLL